MSGRARAVVAFACVIACASVLAAAPPATAPASASAPATRPAMPRSPGFHNLFYDGRLGEKDRRLAYVLFVPKGYDPNRRWPLLLYLCGVGERGNNHQGVYWNGAPLSLKVDKALAQWAPFVVLAPQCPPDLRWDSPGMPRLVMDLLGLAKEDLSVDPDRVYLSGLSMGGAGVWHVAMTGRGVFAVVAPLCAPEVSADKMPDAVRGATVCIVCGGADGGYTAGSRKMYKSLHDAGIDALYVEVPGQGHGVWPAYYASRQFYEFLLMHARGRKPAATRPVAEQLLAISYRAPNSADAQLAGPFKKFLPWWFLTNCGRQNSPGLKDEALGRKNVFVTTPLAEAVPCRLLFTAAIPRDKKTELALAVAAHPQGRWQLVVRANNDELLRETIGEVDPPGDPANRPTTNPSTRTAPPTSAPLAHGAPPTSAPLAHGASPTRPATRPSPWVEFHVDLSAFAGQEARLELLNRSLGDKHPEAYWGSVGLISTESRRP